jgi:serine/threonine-protein kinase
MYTKGDLINDQYEVLQRFSGGMGYVYVVLDQVTRKRLALKTPKDELVDHERIMTRFEREARTWINLGDHENVVRAIVFQRHPQPLLLLEYIEGPSLRQLISSDPGGMAFGQVLRFAVQIADGLAYSHTCPMPGGKTGLVHRDLKPGNILITTAGTAKLTDFGLARAQEDSELTSSDHALGTLHYMPPEQWDNAHNVTHRGDLYAFGVILYEMVTGTRPFPPGTFAEIMYQTLNVAPEPLGDYRPDTDPQLVDVIMQCLRKRAEERPESAAALAATFRGIQARLAPELSRQSGCSACGYVTNKGYVACPVCGNPRQPEPVLEAEPCHPCPHCQRDIPARFRYCVHCGRLAVPLGKCETCGEENPEHYHFCVSCGARLRNLTAPP